MRPLPPVTRFVVRATVLAGLLYGLIYFPYRSENVVVRALSAYLRAITQVAGGAIGLIDPAAAAHGTTIEGRFPLQIVLDCSAADTQALFLGAVLAFPSGWRRKAIGALAGIAGLNLVNVGRIVFLYFAGVHWPDAFHTLHEEVIQIVLVLLAASAFAGWALWARVQPAIPPRPRAV